MTRRDVPRTGDGDRARGRKPKVGELHMLSASGRVQRKQPRGWGLLNILTFGKKHGPSEK